MLEGRVIPSHLAYALMAHVCCHPSGFHSFSPGALIELIDGCLGRFQAISQRWIFRPSIVSLLTVMTFLASVFPHGSIINWATAFESCCPLKERETTCMQEELTPSIKENWLHFFGMFYLPAQLLLAQSYHLSLWEAVCSFCQVRRKKTSTNLLENQVWVYPWFN